MIVYPADVDWLADSGQSVIPIIADITDAIYDLLFAFIFLLFVIFLIIIFFKKSKK